MCSFQEGLHSTRMNTVNMVWRGQGSFWACPEYYTVFFPFFGQYFHTLFSHIHLDSRPAVNLALRGRDACSTKPGIRMCFQIIQVKIFFHSMARDVRGLKN